MQRAKSASSLAALPLSNRVRTRLLLSRLIAPALLALPRAAAASESEQRAPLPESILTESTTDIDADEAGELEFEANLTRVGARAGGAFATLASVELEWRALRRLGLRLEPTYAHITPSGATRGRDAFGLGGAVAVGLWHDFQRDQHLQLELLGRTADHGPSPVFDPGESELPAALDLVGAQRFGRFTLRATAGAEAGGHFAHAPVHTDLCLLSGIESDARFGYLAFELRADWASPAPLVLAPELICDLVPLALPFRIGLALPVNVGASATAPSYGMFLRVILLTERERLSEAQRR
jgi:hypothetical protein